LASAWEVFAAEDAEAFDFGEAAEDAVEVGAAVFVEAVFSTLVFYWAGIADLFGGFDEGGVASFGHEKGGVHASAGGLFNPFRFHGRFLL
jgi:hypothetical protein